MFESRLILNNKFVFIKKLNEVEDIVFFSSSSTNTNSNSNLPVSDHMVFVYDVLSKEIRNV